VLTALTRPALALALGFACAGPPTTHAFAFGRVGGNIAPYTVTIQQDGTVAATGPVNLSDAHRRVPAAVRRRLDALVRTTRFSTLPGRTLCPGSLPDYASSFVTVTSGTTRKRVLVRGSCNAAFEKLYHALAAAAGVRGNP
jgi:hypothetical protein